MSGPNDETRKFTRQAVKTVVSASKPAVGNVSVSKKPSIGDIASKLRYTRPIKLSPEHEKLAREVQDTLRDPEGKEEQNMSKSNLRESIRAFRNLAENSPLEAPVAGFNRHLRDMSPVTRDMVLKGHMPEIMAFAEDRRIDAGIVVGIAEATMRLGRIPDVGMYGLAGDEALAVKHFLADTILNVAEDEVQMLNAVLEDASMSPKAKHMKLASDYKKLAEFHKRRAKEELDKHKIAKEDGRAHSAIQSFAASEKHKTLAMHCMGLADYHQLTSNEHPAADVTKPVDYPASNPMKKPAEPPQDEQKEKSPPTKDPQTESVDAFSRFRALRAKMEQGEDEGAPPAPPQPGRLAKIGGGVKKGLVGTAGAAGDTLNAASKGVGSAAANLASGAGAGAGAAVSGALGGVGSGLRNLGTGLATGKINMPKFNSEATTDASIANAVKPLGSFGPSRMHSILPMIEREPCEPKYSKWTNKFNRKGGDKEMLSGDRMSGQGYPTDQEGDEAERPTDKRKPAEESRAFREAETMESLLTEAKKKKPRRKARVDSEKQKKLLANARIAPLFYDLGHKIDHAQTKGNGKKFGNEWAKKLHDLCLKEGGSVAADAVIKQSVNDHWLREQGFTDEATNLRHNWTTAVSKDATELAKGTTEPEPVVFAINNILKMSSK